MPPNVLASASSTIGGRGAPALVDVPPTWMFHEIKPSQSCGSPTRSFGISGSGSTDGSLFRRASFSSTDCPVPASPEPATHTVTPGWLRSEPIAISTAAAPPGSPSGTLAFT